MMRHDLFVRREVGGRMDVQCSAVVLTAPHVMRLARWGERRTWRAEAERPARGRMRGSTLCARKDNELSLHATSRLGLCRGSVAEGSNAAGGARGGPTSRAYLWDI